MISIKRSSHSFGTPLDPSLKINDLLNIQASGFISAIDDGLKLVPTFELNEIRRRIE